MLSSPGPHCSTAVPPRALGRGSWAQLASPLQCVPAPRAGGPHSVCAPAPGQGWQVPSSPDTQLGLFLRDPGRPKELAVRLPGQMTGCRTTSQGTAQVPMWLLREITEPRSECVCTMRPHTSRLVAHGWAAFGRRPKGGCVWVTLQSGGHCRRGPRGWPGAGCLWFLVTTGGRAILHTVVGRVCKCALQDGARVSRGSPARRTLASGQVGSAALGGSGLCGSTGCAIPAADSWQPQDLRRHGEEGAPRGLALKARPAGASPSPSGTRAGPLPPRTSRRPDRPLGVTGTSLALVANEAPTSRRSP